ncbi:MAG: signal peptidase II [Pseudomonadota bacterium]
MSPSMSDSIPLHSKLAVRQSGWMWLWISVLVIVLDQITKQLVLYSLNPYQNIPVFPFFNITLAFNKGAAFSFLAQADGWQRWFFIGIAVTVSGILLFWLRRIVKTQKCLCVSLTLIFGGAVGNVIDRIIYGHVIDFLDFYWGSAHYPAFNIADSAITLGVILMFVDWFRNPENHS